MVVRSLGPSAKAYPPGKTLPEGAKINLQGGDVVTVLGPSSAKTLRGPGNFDAEEVALASAAGQRGRFGALRSTEVAHNPSIWDVDVSQSGKMCVADPAKLQLWRPESDGAGKVTIQLGRRQDPAAELGRRQGARRLAERAAAQERRPISGRRPDGGDKNNVELVIVTAAPNDSSARRKC